jgi:hypothetical protein
MRIHPTDACFVVTLALVIIPQFFVDFYETPKYLLASRPVVRAVDRGDAQGVASVEPFMISSMSAL